MPWYRRNYLISPKVQLKVVLLLAGVALIASVTICYIAYERMLQLGVLFNQGSVPPAALPQAFEAIARSLMFRLVSIVTLMIFTFGAVGILLTHRIAGPIWKLEKELKRYLNGEKIEPIRFRDSDEFRELPDLINRVLDRIHK